jgi:hypothetical protein
LPGPFKNGFNIIKRVYDTSHARAPLPL